MPVAAKMIKYWFTFQVLSVQSYAGFHHATPVMLVEFLQCTSEGTWASRLQKRLEQRGVAMPLQLCYVQYKEEKITSVFRSIYRVDFSSCVQFTGSLLEENEVYHKIGLIPPDTFKLTRRQ